MAVACISSNVTILLLVINYTEKLCISNYKKVFFHVIYKKFKTLNKVTYKLNLLDLTINRIYILLQFLNAELNFDVYSSVWYIIHNITLSLK